jgi:hypothetical protein
MGCCIGSLVSRGSSSRYAFDVRRLVIYDKTCTWGRRGLSPVWAAGTALYRGLRRIDGSRGAASWTDALGYLAAQDEPIAEVQYWGHGKWGRALIGEESFDATALDTHAAALDAIRERLAPDALWWFRTCETFGARSGHDFAQRLADRLGVRVAGHTYIIAFHQSGLHGLAPGMRPDWSIDEGLSEGTPDDPREAYWSARGLPNTVTALTPAVPGAWFSSARE